MVRAAVTAPKSASAPIRVFLVLGMIAFLPLAGG
jgi:hypothetical protein